EHEGGEARDPVREPGEEPRDLAAAREVVACAAVAARGVEADVHDDPEVERDEAVVDGVDRVELGSHGSGEGADVEPASANNAGGTAKDAKGREGNSGWSDC